MTTSSAALAAPAVKPTAAANPPANSAALPGLFKIPITFILPVCVSFASANRKKRFSEIGGCAQ
jgi:hypothetical protein